MSAVVARPIGGVLFGHIGDRLGRKVATMPRFIGWRPAWAADARW